MKPIASPEPLLPLLKTGALFFAKGYGYADLKARKRVQADKTLFRIASISKLLCSHSQMALLPEQKVGLFICYNTQEGRKAAKETYELFMNRYYPPGEMQVLTSSENSKNRLRCFTGRYFSTRRAHERLTKLGALLGTVNVTLSEDGALKTMGPKTTRWIEMKPLTFREENGHRTLVFRKDE